MFVFPTWFLLAVLNGLSSNTYNFFNRFFLKDGDDSTAYAWFVQLIRVISFGTLAIFDWHLVLVPQSLLLFFLLGITEWISIYLYMKMHAHNHLSISAILSRTRLIWVPIISFVLLHKILQPHEYIGILVIFFGISTIMAPKKLFIDKGALYANAAAFMIGLNSVFFSMTIPYGSNGVLNLALALPSIFLFPLFMKHGKKRIKDFLHGNILFKIFGIAFNIVGLLLFTIALRYGDVSKITAVYQGMMVFSVLAGIIFLKERENIGRKLVGSVVTIVGVVLLVLSW